MKREMIKILEDEMSFMSMKLIYTALNISESWKQKHKTSTVIALIKCLIKSIRVRNSELILRRFSYSIFFEGNSSILIIRKKKNNRASAIWTNATWASLTRGSKWPKHV